MFIQKIKCSRIGKIILEKINEGFMFSRYTFKNVIKIYFKYSNNSVLLPKRRQIYQWKNIESLETDMCVCENLEYYRNETRSIFVNKTKHKCVRNLHI